MKRRMLSYICIVAILVNMLPMPVFSLATIPVGNSIWKEVGTNLSTLSSVEYLAANTSRAYLIGTEQSTGDTKVMYSSDFTTWSEKSVSIETDEEINYFDYIGSNIYMGFGSSGNYGLDKYDGSSTRTSVIDNLNSPIVAGVETQVYYSSWWSSDTPGHMVLATDSGTLYEISVDASGYHLADTHEAFISAGIADMTYYGGKYIIVDKAGTIHTGTSFDTAWETDALSTNSQKITSWSADQYIAGSDGGTTRISKGSGSGTYSVSTAALASESVEIGDFDYLSGTAVLTGKNISTGKSYVVASSDGTSWEQEYVKFDDNSDATVKLIDAAYKSGALYAISDTSQVFKRIPELVITMNVPYSAGSTSVSLNAYAQTGGTSVSNKGIEVTLAADTTFSSATTFESNSYDSWYSSSSSISATATGLTQNTDYIARAFAENEIGVAYSDSVSFTTDKIRGLTLIPESLIEESNIDGVQIVMNLDSDTFVDTTIDPANLTLNNFPAGVSIDSVNYIDSTKATIVLAFDYDNNITDAVGDANISIAGTEVTSGQQWDSNDITIYDEYETPRALVNGLGGTKGFGEYTMSVDDDYFKTVDLTSVFPEGVEFGSSVYTQVDININGALHFGNIGDGSHSSFTPTGIAGATSPIIAPFWTDIDVSRSAQGITNEYDEAGNLVGHSTGSNRVYYDFDTENKIFTVTWDDVSAYSSSTTGAAAFQVRLHNIGGDNMSIEIIYENLEYGGSSGAARMGWSTGDNPSPGGTEGVDYYEFPASGDADAIVLLPNRRGPSGQVGTYQSSLVDGVVTNVLADNNNIVGLDISSGTLAPSVTSAITGYSASVSSDVESITLTPTLESTEATMTVNNAALSSGDTSQAIALSSGLNEIVILVTAQDGSEKTYTISVLRGEPVQYTVSYDSNGGTAVAESLAYADAVISEPVQPVRAGYAFAGWYADATLNSEWDFDNDTVQESRSLYAKWLALDYHVSYSSNGADAGLAPTDDQNYNYGNMAEILGNTGNLVKAGYSFEGWNTATDGYGTDYAVSSDVTVTEDMTLFAKWTALPTMRVTYDANGSESGTVPTDGNDYLEGADVTVSGNTGNLVKTGYAFVGWNTSSAGTGTMYQKDDVHTMDTSDVTLYASWTALPTYTVTYDGNGAEAGTLPSDDAHYLEGQSVRVLDRQVYLQKSGYTFIGWNTEADGTGTHFALEASLSMPSENLTLYAEWELIPTYRVTYNGNGNESGEEPLDNNDYIEGAAVSIQGNPDNLSKTGYRFAGWNTEAAGTGTGYTIGDTLNMGTTALVLYAQWEALPTYSLTYDKNGALSGNLPQDNNSYYASSLVTVQGNPGTLARYGYDFDGWNTQADGSGTVYRVGQTFTMDSGNETLYAIWTPLPRYSIVYDDNGSDSGSRPMNDTSYLPGETATVLNNTGSLTKAGYAFAGWNTLSDGSGTNYTSGYEIEMEDANITLYANWNQLPTYSVTYHGNGAENGSVPVDETSYLEGDPLFIQENEGNLIRYGYELIGWNTSSSLDGSFYKASERIGVGSANIDLYAQWTPLPTYRVSYDGNGEESGAVPEDTGLYLQNETVTVQAKSDQLVKTGYAFDGWNTESDGSGTLYEAEDTYAMGSANITLYAQWSALPTYTITYNGNGNESGLVPVDSNTYLEDATVTIYGNSGALAKTGYLFAGWNTSADGSGKNLAPGLAIPMTDSNVTLYAKWVLAPRYSVLYDGNGNDSGLSPVDNNGYLSGAQAVVLGSGKSMARTGYTFAGWNSSAIGTGTTHSAISVLGIEDDDVTLYAQWDLASYTLNYDPVLDVTSPASISLEYTALLQKPTDPETSEYILTGWYYDEALSNPVDFTSDTMPASDLTIYAAWMDSKYTLSFDDGYDITTPSSIQVTYGNALYEPQDPVRAGYTFSGWYYDQALTHSVSFMTDTMPASALTLYAKWGVNPYTITYSAGVDVISPSAAMTDYLTQIPEPTEPQKEGYSFGGWYYDSAYADAVDFENDTMPAHDLTLYAKWQINQYTVTLNYGYETTSGSSITVTYGDKVNPGTPVRSGYDFGAWYRDSVFSELWDVVSDTMPAMDMTLYAQWSMVIGADLSDLDAQTYGLNETFSASRTSYTVSDVVDSQIDIRAYASPDQYSTVTVNAQAVDTDGWITVNLENGENTFDILVTAQDGVTTKKYTLVVYKLYDEAVLSDVTATGGNGVSGFDSGVRSYDMGSTKLSQITISATAFADIPVSKIEIAGVTVASGVSQTINLLYGVNVIDVDVVAEDGVTTGTYELTIQRLKAESGSSSSRTGTTRETTPTETDERTNTVTVIVNGQPKSAGTETITESADRKSAEITVVRDVIEAEIKAVITQTATAENIIQVPISESDVDNVKVGLTGDIIKLMEDNAFDLSIESGDAEYVIPAKEFEIVNVARLLEVDENNLVDIEVNVSVEKVENAKIAEIQSKLGTTMKMLAAPVAFKVEATATNRSGITKTVEVEKFSEFVKRRIDLPDMTDRTQITTAVIYNDDGSYSHIPTAVEVVDGVYKAVINSLTNSVYTVIWNSVEFEDMSSHWAKDAVNDLGSRLVVSGKGENVFKPDDRVTRAEFSAMVVQGLGILRPDQESSTFEDISESDWYQDAVSSANAYGLISGYPDNTFKPLENIKREEAFAVAYNAMKIAGYVPVEVTASDILSAFADQDEVAGWAQNATAGLVECGVVSGFDGQINPEGLLTRAEAAVLIRSILTYNGLIN